MNEYTKKMLEMEDIIERMMELDKKAAAEVGADREEIVGGKCTSCEKLYPSEYLTEGNCIPCWREKNDLPKIDTETDF